MKKLTFQFILLFLSSSLSAQLSQPEARVIAARLEGVGTRMPDNPPEPSYVNLLLPKGKTLTIDWRWDGTRPKMIKIWTALGDIAAEEYNAGSNGKKWQYTNTTNQGILVNIICVYKENGGESDWKHCAGFYESITAANSGSKKNEFYVAYSDRYGNDWGFGEAVGKLTW